MAADEMRRKAGPNDIRDKHATRGEQKQSPAPESINHHGSQESRSEPIEDLKKSIDKSLVLNLGNTDRVENQNKIIADDSNTIPLSKPTNDDSNKRALAV